MFLAFRPGWRLVCMRNNDTWTTAPLKGRLPWPRTAHPTARLMGYRCNQTLRKPVLQSPFDRCTIIGSRGSAVTFTSSEQEKVVRAAQLAAEQKPQRSMRTKWHVTARGAWQPKTQRPE
ncbi:hypothetical protein AAFF_G00092630 [Aldrovandia affinis]|uniref:Uncharacterized protein n=1 Tax=Aldrovandia affinis TaxID=143900 RepID=A0AAD7T2M4_9TELE|nr:hypothetical protein AAFF_G00092630 [Aldrovandia affinis]